MDVEAKKCLDLGKRVVQVVEEVTSVFNTDGKSDEVLFNTELLSDFQRDGSMGHNSRAFDQTLDTTEGLSKSKDANGFKEFLRFGKTAIKYI